MTATVSGQLRQRVCHVTVGTLLLEGTDGTGLDVEFNIRKNLKPEPNSCTLKIYNLNADHRNALSQSSTVITGPQSPPGTGGVVVPVRIDAGYASGTSQIWLGELRASETKHDGANYTTILTTGDGDKAVTRQRVNVSVGPGTTSATAMRTLLQALGIGTGNLPKALNLLNQQGSAQLYANGAMIKGLAADHMTDLVRSAGLEWSIQDGQLQVLNVGQPLDGQAILISESAGMVGSPSVDTKGILSFTTLMIPGIKPGIKVSVQTETPNTSGGYRIIAVEYTGDTLGQEWYCKCEAMKY
jgi:baseplate hub protein gp41